MERKKLFAILGLGRFGSSIVKTLSEQHAEVLACDKNTELVQEYSKIATYAIKANIADNAALEEMGLGNFDVVIITVGSNLEASMIATIHAKEKGCKQVIVKANNFMQKYILEKIGADRVILPEREMGEKLALSLLSGNFVDIINLSDKFSLLEILPLKEWINKNILQAEVRAKYGVNILAIRRNKELIVSPKADEVIKENDMLFVIGDNKDLNRIKVY